MKYTLVVLLSLLPFAASASIIDAARSGDIPAIEAFLQAGEEVDTRTPEGYTPFILAAYHAHDDALAVLKKAGAKPCAVDARGSNAFMGVAFRGHLNTAKWLLDNTDCDVNALNATGQTALMMAALFGREDIIRLLLDKGADASVKDAMGNTAHSLAKMQGASEELLKLLEK